MLFANQSWPFTFTSGWPLTWRDVYCVKSSLSFGSDLRFLLLWWNIEFSFGSLGSADTNHTWAQRAAADMELNHESAVFGCFYKSVFVSSHSWRNWAAGYRLASSPVSHEHTEMLLCVCVLGRARERGCEATVGATCRSGTGQRRSRSGSVRSEPDSRSEQLVCLGLTSVLSCWTFVCFSLFVISLLASNFGTKLSHPGINMKMSSVSPHVLFGSNLFL